MNKIIKNWLNKPFLNDNFLLGLIFGATIYVTNLWVIFWVTLIIISLIRIILRKIIKEETKK
jgi:hypothetical protein